MPPATAASNSYRVDEMAYPSRTIAFQAASMITSIVENLQSHEEIRYMPAFMYVVSKLRDGEILNMLILCTVCIHCFLL